MRNTIFGRRGLSWMLAVALALALPGVRPAWAVASSAAATLISSKLPADVTLRHASTEQMVAAVRAAVKEHPEMAPNIVRAAILAKSPRHGEERDFKDAPIDFKDAVGAPCPYVLAVTRAAIESAPDKANDIVQVALALDPDCADALNNVASTVDGFDPNGFGDGFDDGGFGAGFGPGFPGTPGFLGTPPAGAVALPPVPILQTTTQG